MPSMTRQPSVSLPRTDGPHRLGVGMAAGAHAFLLLIMLVHWSGDEYHLATGAPGGGGGGGGGGASVRYVELPPLASPASARRVQPEPPRRVPEPQIETPEDDLPQVPKPVLRQAPDRPIDIEVPPTVTAVANVATLGTGSGSGFGPGRGAGSGGGVGTGHGPGIGSGTGPGEGEGGAVIAPEVRTVVYPFEQPPASIRGQQFRVRFWVDEQGRVTRVEIEPEIDDKSFREKLLKRMRQWTFYAARTVEGRRVKGQLVVTYEP